MSELENALLGLETSLDFINETLESNTEYLKMISRELLISNLPQEIHKKQRLLFGYTDYVKNTEKIMVSYMIRLSQEKDGPASEGLKKDIEKYKKEIVDYNDKIDDFIVNYGCVRV